MTNSLSVLGENQPPDVRYSWRSFSSSHRPDLNQMILAVLLDGDGRPVCPEMWPGNTADTGSLIPVVDRLRKRFSVSRVCVVADRGMISAETTAELEARGLLYILGVGERTDKQDDSASVSVTEGDCVTSPQQRLELWCADEEWFRQRGQGPR